MKYLYIIAALLNGLSYWYIHSYIIMQGPPQRYISVSNLTLNYVLFYMFIGGTTYWVASKRLFKSLAPIKCLTLSAGLTAVVTALILALLSPWYQLRG